MPIVAMPDGSRVSFPDDMPKEQIKGLIASKFPDAAPINPANVRGPNGQPATFGINQEGNADYIYDKNARPTTEQAVGGLVGKYGQGLTVGLGDELQAAIGAPFRVAAGKIVGGDADISLSDAYTKGLEQARGGLKAAEQEFPVGSVLAEIAGGITPGAAAYKGAGALGMTSAKTALGRRAKESILGAIGSGIYGFNTGEGDNRTESALKNAALGAFISPAVGYGAEKLTNIASPVVNRVVRSLSPEQVPDNQLAAQLKSAIEAGDEQTKNALLAQIGAGKTSGLPYDVPLSKGNLQPTLANQDIEEKALKGALGGEPQRIMTEFTTKQNQALRSNISSLIRDNDLPANAVGDDIVESVTKAYRSAKGAKTAAYNQAKPLMEQAFVPKDKLAAFASQMDDSLAEFPADIAAKVKREFEAEIARAGDAAEIPFSKIELFRKKLNNLGAMGSPESAAGGRVKSQLDAFLDSGVITGEQGAVEAITKARALSAGLKREYQTKTASPIVREIVAAVDNNTQLAPEKIFQAISTGSSKQNAANVKSLVKILGEDHPTVAGLRDGILKDIRDRATDASGFVSPAKLAGNIDKLIYANRTMANTILSPNEIKMLKSLQEVSRKIAYKAPGVVNSSNSGNLILRQLDALSRTFVGRNTPFFGNVVNSLKESSAANRVQKSVAPMIEAKPIYGGIPEKITKIDIFKRAGE